MKRVAFILLGMIILPAYANIASTAYTDAEFKGVSDAIKLKADKGGYTANGVLQTGADGKVTSSTLKTNMIETGAVTNSKLASGIGLDKLDVGELPTSGKHIMIWNSATNKYVFEEFTESTGSAGLQCPAGQYDIGFDQCIGPAPGADEIAYGFISNDGADRVDETDYNLSENGSWGVTLYTGDKITGIASCNSTLGRYNVATDTEFSNTSTGGNCWCKIISPAASRWVFVADFAFDDDDEGDFCGSQCAYSCAYSVLEEPDFWAGVFSSVGQ